MLRVYDLLSEKEDLAILEKFFADPVATLAEHKDLPVHAGRFLLGHDIDLFLLLRPALVGEGFCGIINVDDPKGDQEKYEGNFQRIACVLAYLSSVPEDERGKYLQLVLSGFDLAMILNDETKDEFEADKVRFYKFYNLVLALGGNDETFGPHCGERAWLKYGCPGPYLNHLSTLTSRTYPIPFHAAVENHQIILEHGLDSKVYQTCLGLIKQIYEVQIDGSEAADLTALSQLIESLDEKNKSMHLPLLEKAFELQKSFKPMVIDMQELIKSMLGGASLQAPSCSMQDQPPKVELVE